MLNTKIIHKIGSGLSTIISTVDLISLGVLDDESKKEQGLQNIRLTCHHLLELLKEHSQAMKGKE